MNKERSNVLSVRVAVTHVDLYVLSVTQLSLRNIIDSYFNTGNMKRSPDEYTKSGCGEL